MAIINVAIYSTRPWPYGCSESAGFSASWNPQITTPEDITSERVWIASAMTLTDPIIIPIINFITNKSPLIKTDTQP